MNGLSPGKPLQGHQMLGAIKPYDRKPATVGNGVMVSLYMDSIGKVDSMHKKALELGSPDEGGFYGGYFRDMDGNKLCVFHLTQAD